MPRGLRVEKIVSSIDCARTSLISDKFIRLAGMLLSAATLAACAQSSVVPDKSALRGGGRSIATDQTRQAPRETSTTARRDPLSGFASYYSQGVRTASGEHFD